MMKQISEPAFSPQPSFPQPSCEGMCSDVENVPAVLKALLHHIEAITKSTSEVGVPPFFKVLE